MWPPSPHIFRSLFGEVFSLELDGLLKESSSSLNRGDLKTEEMWSLIWRPMSDSDLRWLLLPPPQRGGRRRRFDCRPIRATFFSAGAWCVRSLDSLRRRTRGGGAVVPTKHGKVHAPRF